MSNDSVDVGKTIGKYTVYFDSSRKTDRFRTYPQDGPVRFISYPTSAIIAKANGSQHEIKGTVFNSGRAPSSAAHLTEQTLVVISQETGTSKRLGDWLKENEQSADGTRPAAA